MAKPGDQGSWVRRFHDAADARAQLVCFPHAGGSASYFFPVSAALSPEFDVRIIQYPGRQDRLREPFVETVNALAEHAYTALLSVVDRPVALFGHSMGAQVAFEVACRFERSAGIRPATVFVSASRAPSCVRAEHVQLGDDAAVVEYMRKLGGTDPRLLEDAELRQMVLPAFRNDFQATEQYRRGVDMPISAPIVVMTAVDDPRTTVDEAAAWGDHTSGGAEMNTFDGGHFYLERHANRVIAMIGERLRRAIGDPTAEPPTF